MMEKTSSKRQRQKKRPPDKEVGPGIMKSCSDVFDSLAQLPAAVSGRQVTIEISDPACGFL